MVKPERLSKKASTGPQVWLKIYGNAPKAPASNQAKVAMPQLSRLRRGVLLSFLNNSKSPPPKPNITSCAESKAPITASRFTNSKVIGNTMAAASTKQILPKL